jgi:hypothetical protein
MKRRKITGVNSIMSIPAAARSDVLVYGSSIFWDCGFESHWKHGSLSLVSVVCCEVELSVTG